MIDIRKVMGLLRSVPRPANVVIPPGTSDGEIDEFSKRNGLQVPEDLRTWLRACNAPFVGPGLFGLRTMGLDIDVILGLFPEWQKKKWIPIGGDGCGNYYVITTQHEFGPGYPVLFIETYPDTKFVVASDLEHFLLFFILEQLTVSDHNGPKWPFDKDYVIASDPNILLFPSYLMPWGSGESEGELLKHSGE